MTAKSKGISLRRIERRARRLMKEDE